MEKRILIAYYSHSGNTRRIAELIAGQTGGTLYEIKPQTAYPENYSDVVAQAKKEIHAGYLPPLHPGAVQTGGYDMVFVGTPNWWSTMAPPVAAFLTETDFSGKLLVPFCTHGGGGVAHIQRDMEKRAPAARVLEAFDCYGNGGSGAEAKIAGWLEKIGLRQ